MDIFGDFLKIMFFIICLKKGVIVIDRDLNGLS